MKGNIFLAMMFGCRIKNETFDSPLLSMKSWWLIRFHTGTGFRHQSIIPGRHLLLMHHLILILIRETMLWKLKHLMGRPGMHCLRLSTLRLVLPGGGNGGSSHWWWSQSLYPWVYISITGSGNSEMKYLWKDKSQILNRRLYEPRWIHILFSIVLMPSRNASSLEKLKQRIHLYHSFPDCFDRSMSIQMWPMYPFMKN